MNSSRTVIVYRDTLLPASETFIRAQAESLRRFRPLYVGLRRRTGLSLPETRVRILSGSGMLGKLKRARFKILGSTVGQQGAIAREAPALIHAHFGPDGCDVLHLARALDLPLIVSLHGYDVTNRDDHLPRLYVRRRKLLTAYGARFICISDFIRNKALYKDFPAEKTLVHYTGVDTEFFRADPSIQRYPIVLFVGRLAPNKGCEYLIRAMASVQNVRREIKLVVIGDGPLREELEQQASSILQSFEFLGVQSPVVVRQWMNRATVFSCPCVVTPAGDEEGFGMVFAEAQAMGLPVVSCTSGGIPEVVAHEHTGFLVPERDWEGLATKLLLLLQNQNLRGRFGEAGRVRVEQLFDVRKQATALERIYDSVLGEVGAEVERKPKERSQ